MPVKLNFSMDSIKKELQEEQEAIGKALLEAFRETAMNAVEKAKLTNTYTDQTGHLRSSIGYVLFYDGEEIGNYFGETSSPEGTSQSLKEARSMVDVYKRPGIVVIIVAGMHYASYVEEIHGLDVLSGSLATFQDELKLNLEEVKKTFE